MKNSTVATPKNVQQYLLGLRHVGVITENLEGLVSRLSEVFGLTHEDVLRIPADDSPSDTRFAFFSIGGTPYEVIEPVSERFRKLLLNSGTGTNHVCYTVTDLEAAVDAMAASGVRLGHVTPEGIVDTPRFRMAYFDPEDTAGLLIEFVEDKS